MPALFSPVVLRAGGFVDVDVGDKPTFVPHGIMPHIPKTPQTWRVRCAGMSGDRLPKNFDDYVRLPTTSGSARAGLSL